MWINRVLELYIVNICIYFNSIDIVNPWASSLHIYISNKLTVFCRDTENCIKSFDIGYVPVDTIN